MKNIYQLSWAALLLTILFSACQKDDYFVGGDLHRAKVDVSTYDFLKNNDRGLFDTLIMLVDAAGLKEAINKPGITFFAPTDYSIRSYVEKRTELEQRVDPFRKWTVDSILKYELSRFADSLSIYIVPQEITYAGLTGAGEIFRTQKGNEVVLSYEETNDPALGYNPNSSFLPQVMYFTHLFGPIETPFQASQIPSTLGVRTRVQTSGIESTTGRINVLENGHRLFFFR